MKVTKLLGLVVCLLMMAGMAFGQGTGASGEIRGTVTDPTGAVLSKATVTATDTGKGTKRVAVSDSEGEYHFTALPPAVYDIGIQAGGFQTTTQKGVEVNVGQTVNLDFKLKVSKAAESVEVTTEPPLVDTSAIKFNRDYVADHSSGGTPLKPAVNSNAPRTPSA